MPEKTEARKRFLINILFISAIVVIIYIFFKYVFSWIAPFVVGIVIAIALDPLIRLINKKLRVKRTPVAILITVLLWIIIGFIIFKIGEVVYNQALNLLEYINTLDPKSIVSDISKWITNQINDAAPELVKPVNDMLSQAASALVSFATSILQGLTGFLFKLPDILIFLVVSIMASIFISIDLPKIKTFFELQIPKKNRIDFIEARDFFQNKIFNLVRAYAIILTITFLELLVCFYLIGIQYAFLLAMLVALLDLLPIIGTSTFLVPWGIITMIGGDIKTGIWLIVIAVVVSVVREIIQPRIVGSQIGLSPLLTLLSMYVGLKIFGLIGMFIVPLLLIFLKNLNDSGKIRLWKTPENDES